MHTTVTMLFRLSFLVLSHRLVCLDSVLEVGHRALEGLDVGKTLLDLLVLQLHLLLDLLVAGLKGLKFGEVGSNLVQLY
jgi:hypothetical protein